MSIKTVDFRAVDEYIHAHIGAWMDELRALCAIPSVSARHEAIQPCAELVSELLSKRGFRTTISTAGGGHPVVLGHAPAKRTTGRCSSTTTTTCSRPSRLRCGSRRLSS